MTREKIKGGFESLIVDQSNYSAMKPILKVCPPPLNVKDPHLLANDTEMTPPIQNLDYSEIVYSVYINSICAETISDNVQYSHYTTPPDNACICDTYTPIKLQHFTPT